LIAPDLDKELSISRAAEIRIAARSPEPTLTGAETGRCPDPDWAGFYLRKGFWGEIVISMLSVRAIHDE
jgi:hypothetical protein